jgi:hypothetical protein
LPDEAKKELPSNFQVQAVAFEPVFDGVFQLGKSKLDPARRELCIELEDHVGGGRVNVGDRFGCDDDPTRSGRGQVDCVDHASAEGVCVREKKRGIPADQQEARNLPRIRVARDVVVPLHAIGATQYGVVRAPGTPNEVENRNTDGERDALDDAQGRDAQEGHDRQNQVGPSHAMKDHERGEVEDTERRRDDDRSKRSGG